MNLSRKRSTGLTALFGTLLSFSAFAEVKEGDIYVILGEAHTSPNSSGGVLVEKTVTLEASNGEFTQIYIASPNRDAPVRVEEGGSQVMITANLASDSESSIRAFAQDSSHQMEGSDLKLHMGGFIYECQSFRLFGKRSVKGVCIDGITVRLPPMSKTVVYVTANQSNGKFITVAETLQILEAMSFDDARVEVAELLSR